MQKIKSIAFALVIGFAAIGLSAATASATVVWNVDGTGQLTGAQNVDVGGTLYDVTFADGTCTGDCPISCVSESRGSNIWYRRTRHDDDQT